MGRGISETFIADVSPFLRGTADMEAALEDVSGSLDDLVRDSATSADDMARELTSATDEIARDTETATEKMERSFKDAFDAVERDAKTSQTNVSTHIRKAADDSIDTAGEIKNETKANIGEMVGSFDGSLQSIIGTAQGIAGGLTQALGPGGLIATAAAGIGIGVAYNLFQKGKEKAAELKRVYNETVKDMTTAMLDANGQLDKAWRDQKIQEWITGLEDKFAETDKKAQALGLTVGILARAKFGDPKAIEAVNDALDKQRHLVEVNEDAISKDVWHTSQGFHDAAAAVADANDNIDFLTDTLGDFTGQAEEAKKRVDAVKDATTEWGTEISDLPDDIVIPAALDVAAAKAGIADLQKDLDREPLSIKVKTDLDPVSWQATVNKVNAQAARWEIP